MLEIILRRYGKTLRSLHLKPHGHFRENAQHKPSELLKVSPVDVQRIAESCPNLTEIDIHVSRCHGEVREVAVYRALSRLRHLKRACLYLYHWVVPDENASENIPEEDMHQGCDDDDVMLAHLKDAIIDCAVDETIARSIFDMITRDAGTETSNSSPSTARSHSNSRWLCLHVRRRQGMRGEARL